MRGLKTALVALISMPMAMPVVAAPERFVLDPSHVSIGFLAGHARFANVLGLFSDVEGEFVYDEQARELISGEVTIDARSVFTGHQGRDDHLRKEDFLHTGEHAQIRFEATDYVADDQNGGMLSGNLTLRGVTQPITLDVTLNRRDAHPIGGRDTLGGSARGSLLRSEYGMDYALQDDLVSDHIELIIEFEAMLEDG